jgi:hypothetical protein
MRDILANSRQSAEPLQAQTGDDTFPLTGVPKIGNSRGIVMSSERQRHGIVLETNENKGREDTYDETDMVFPLGDGGFIGGNGGRVR